MGYISQVLPIDTTIQSSENHSLFSLLQQRRPPAHRNDVLGRVTFVRSCCFVWRDRSIRIMWQRAVVFPAPEDEWEWAAAPVLGLPCLLRLLVVLRQAGIYQVGLPLERDDLQQMLAAFDHRAALPLLHAWQDTTWPEEPGPVLGVRGGMLCTPHLLGWFWDTLSETPTGNAIAQSANYGPVLVSGSPEVFRVYEPQTQTFGQFAASLQASSHTVPNHIFCRPVRELRQPGGDRRLLDTVGKATDRWHVEWVRRWSFPALRWLARAGITPNQVTWAGFGVALVACMLIASGQYWLGILGALLLYGSWVLDCLDGTLARLTFTTSAAGERLDTSLGHVSNLAIFGAIIWAVYGAEPWWHLATIAGLILGGMSIAHWVSQEAARHRPASEAVPDQRLRGWLAKINHRDYAVWILLLAVLDGFHVFLWLSVVGIQVYWLLQLWLLYTPLRVKTHS